jgi:putative nucleotidyltransferase with HDIG domain
MTAASQYIDGIQNLPPAPTVLKELLAIFSEADQEMDDVVKLISYDPSLTAEFLKRANSAFFSGDEPASNAFEAITRLGFYEAFYIVAGLFAASVKSLPGVDESLDADALWRHSVATAVAASIVAEAAEESKAAAFTSGLLHDIGKLVLASAERGRYGKLTPLANGHGPCLLEVEQQTFGTDHAEIGAKLLARWNLPSEIVIAVRHHHDFKTLENHEHFSAIVHLANITAHGLRDDDPSIGDLALSATGSLEKLNLTTKDFRSLIGKTEEGLEQVKGLLEL